MQFLAFDFKPDAETDRGEARVFEATSDDGAAIAWARDADTAEDIARGNIHPIVWIVAADEPIETARAFKVSGAIELTYSARESR